VIACAPFASMHSIARPSLAIVRRGMIDAGRHGIEEYLVWSMLHSRFGMFCRPLLGLTLLAACAADEITCPLIGCPPELRVSLSGAVPQLPWRVEAFLPDGTPLVALACEVGAPRPCVTSTQLSIGRPAPERVTVRITTPTRVSESTRTVSYQSIAPAGLGPECATCPSGTLTIPWP
jgi:hypothetical protein